MLRIDDLARYFSEKKVFITGHTGFKGSWLALLLSEIGAEVTGFSLPPLTNPSHFDLINLPSKINHIEGNINDAAFLKETICEFQPEFVFHLAAQALVQKSYEDASSTFEINIMGSINLLEAVRSCASIRSLIYVTSDKCYENTEWIWGYREIDKLGGHDPYSASKAAAEIVFSSYQASFFNERTNLGAASTRAGNVIGGGDWAENRIIPDCIRAIEKQEPIILRNPEATRPWQHVLEPISGYLSLAIKLYEEPKKWSGAWNFGPSTHEVKTVLDLAHSITKLIGKGSIEIEKAHSKKHEANLLQLNCDKAHQKLGWNQRWKADRCIEATALWYKQVLNGNNTEKISLDQIYEYFQEM